MGTWIPEIAPIGVWQTWYPEHRGDWPTYADEQKASMGEGVIPPPCDTCGGLLKRRQLITNTDEIQSVARTNDRQLRAALFRKQDPPAPIPVPDPLLVWHYDLWHFRRCAGDAQATPDQRSGLGSLDDAIAKVEFDPKQLRIVDQQRTDCGQYTAALGAFGRPDAGAA